MTHRSDVTDIAHRYLEGARKRYEQQGDKGVILRCIHRCLSWDVPPPEWLWTAFDDAYQKARSLEIDSWDDVFGTIVPKNKQRKVAEKQRKLAGQVFSLVHRLNASDPKKYPKSRGNQHGAGAFAEAAKILGLKSAREAEELYRPMERTRKFFASLTAKQR